MWVMLTQEGKGQTLHDVGVVNAMACLSYVSAPGFPYLIETTVPLAATPDS